MKAIVFGTGKFFENREKYIRYLNPELSIVAFIDNNSKKRDYKGRRVYKPERINELNFDRILLMSRNSEEMRRQLLSFGVANEKILDWDQFLILYRRGEMQFYCGHEGNGNGKRILVLTAELNYNGGTIAAAYAVKAMQDKGYQVCLAAENGNLPFVYEMVEMGINVVLYPKLGDFGAEERFFIRQFDVVLVNVFQMIRFAVIISKMRSTLWWIHEPIYLIEETIERFPEYADINCFEDLKIYAVSPVPRTNFNHFFPKRINGLLPYGIPDYNCAPKTIIKGKNEKIVFALVGTFVFHKSQDLFLKATLKMHSNDAEFWMIGSVGDEGFFKEIQEKAEVFQNVRLFGEFSREEMGRIYDEIDVLVCPSRKDSLPIVCTEAMMYGKPVIVSDSTGTAHYIENGKNGFVCKTDDADDLREKMEWIINNPKELPIMGEQARKTYELYFSMDKFADRLEELLCQLFQS